MGKRYERLDESLERFIEDQRMFFVATAPSGSEGHVNVSPKGLDSFVVLDEQRVAYLDFVGSGAETIAHLRDNGRICVMFCAFEGPPKILRLYGKGQVIEPQDPQFRAIRTRFGSFTNAMVRAVIQIDVERIADACGYGVPRYAYQGDRGQLEAFATRKGADGMLDYQRNKNAKSIDQLPALRWPEEPPKSGGTQE